MQEVDLVFRGVNVDVDIFRSNLERHVHKGVAALREVSSVDHLNRLLES